MLGGLLLFSLIVVLIYLLYSLMYKVLNNVKVCCVSKDLLPC